MAIMIGSGIAFVATFIVNETGTVLRIIAPSCHHYCSVKAISMTNSERVFVALGIQHAMCMRHIVIWGLRGSTKFFPHFISSKAHFSEGWGGKLLSIKCVFRLSLQLSSETFLILRRNGRDMIEDENGSSRKIPVTLVRS